jgi:hypothetical protein
MSCPLRATHALAGAPLLTHGHRDTRPPPPRVLWCSSPCSGQDSGTVELSSTRDVRLEVTWTGDSAGSQICIVHASVSMFFPPPPGHQRSRSRPAQVSQASLVGNPGEPRGIPTSGIPTSPWGLAEWLKLQSACLASVSPWAQTPVLQKKKKKVVNSVIILKYIYSWIIFSYTILMTI